MISKSPGGCCQGKYDYLLSPLYLCVLRHCLFFLNMILLLECIKMILKWKWGFCLQLGKKNDMNCVLAWDCPVESICKTLTASFEFVVLLAPVWLDTDSIWLFNYLFKTTFFFFFYRPNFTFYQIKGSLYLKALSIYFAFQFLECPL